MLEQIRELRQQGIQVLPIKYHDNKFIHPPYSDKFALGFTDDEISLLARKGYNSAIAVMHGKCNPSLICLDFDEKNAPGKNLYESWRHLVDEDVFRKLVIEKTKSNGYHVYFLCMHLPPEKALASSAGNEEWIAARSAKHDGITYCAPSPGYTELQGSLAGDLQELTREQMIEVCDAAAQLNEYTGAHTAKGTQLPAVLIPGQYSVLANVFDRKVPESFTIDYLLEQGWKTDGVSRFKPGKDGEKWEYVKMWRPGRSLDEPYSANYWLKAKKLSVFTASTPMPSFDSGQSFTHSPSAVLYYMMNCDWQAVSGAILDLCEKYEISLPRPTDMVYFVQIGKQQVAKVEVKGIIEWAERMGYRWMSISGNDETVVQLVRVVDNIIYEVDDKDLVRVFRKHIEAEYDDSPDSTRCLTNFIPSLMSYMNALPMFDMDLMRDTVDTAYLYFSNGALKITKQDAVLLKYSELNACVFAKHIKGFDYREVGGWGVFGDFVSKIVEDEKHRQYLMNALGYIIHYYKLRNYAKALMIIEDVEDQEEARGRSGKGLIAQFVEWLRWVVQQDGRNYKSDSQFKMQRIVPGVQVYYLNDPAPGVLMNQFYNFVTDDWLVEAKGKKAYSIPFKHSPKILITTNYLPNLESDSDKDRFIIMPIKKVFGSKYSVRDAFPGVIFFDDHWREDDALGAVRFAVDCVQGYLREGVPAYNNSKMQENANRRVISNAVPTAIIETMEAAMECWKGAKNSDDFMLGMAVVDMKKDMPESLKKAFDWEPAKLIIYMSKLYQYCRSSYQMKDINDKVFGRKVRTWLSKSGFEDVFEGRSKHQGRHLEVYLEREILNIKNKPNAFLDGLFDGTEGEIDGTGGGDITDF